MEKNYISKCKETCFYIDLVSKTYGVYINIKDLKRAKEIIQHFRKDRKLQIEAWKQEWKEGVA